MDVDKTIAEIAWLERLYSLVDTRPFYSSEAAQPQDTDRHLANQRHDEKYAKSPWFRLWRRYGLPR